MIKKIQYRIKWMFFNLLTFLGFKPSKAKRKGELQVVCFHGVCEDSEHFINGRFIKKTQLKKLLIELQKYVNIVSWDEVEAGRLPQDQLNVLITFDDGYLNNKTILLPIIEDLQIPIVLFVTGRNGKPLWPDLLDVAMANEVNLSTIFENGLDLKNNQEIKKYLINLDEENIEKITLELVSLTQPFSKDYLNFHQLLTNEEIMQLAKNPYITVGNHSMNHLAMNQLDIGKMKSEIDEVNKIFKNSQGYRSTIFAFPFGVYHKENVIHLKEMGIDYQFVLDTQSTAGNVINRMAINPFVSENVTIRSILNGRY